MITLSRNEFGIVTIGGMVVDDVTLSRAVSHALRHEPWLYELELDREGWTPVDQLLHALRERGGDWAAVDRDAVRRMMASASKQRFELDGDRIRARYGHSLAGRIHLTPGTPPPRLFHGTAPDTVPIIRTQGLRPMGRQYVHLSVDVETARSVGQRKSGRPVLLAVDAAAAAATGVVFYRGNDRVWLADAIPPEQLEPLA